MNCLIGAILIRWRIGGMINYRLPTLASPWGHWSVVVGLRILSYESLEADLPWWHQLWFSGRLKVKTSK